MLSKEIKQLSIAERILLVEEIWDSVADKKVKVTNDEIEYTRKRIEKINNGKGKSRSWGAIKAELI